jgi:HK97 family phage portal protein
LSGLEKNTFSRISGESQESLRTITGEKPMGKKKQKKKTEIRADTMQGTEVSIADDVLLSAIIGRSMVTREMSLQIPTVRGCINKIAAVVSSIPIKLYRHNEEGMPEEILEDSRLRILNDDTGDTLTASQFWKAMLEDYYVGKGGYAYINRERGSIKSLHYVANNHVSFLYNNDPIFKDYNILVDGKTFQPFQFFKVLRNTKDGMKSSSLAEENPVLVSLAYSSLIYEENLVKKGGNKRGFLQSEKPLTDEAMEKLKAAYSRMYSNNSENVVVLNNGIKFQEASNTSVEMQLNENKKSNGDEICKLMGVPAGVLTGSATEKDWEIFLQTCVDVMADIECSLDRDLLLEKEKGVYYWAFDTRELMRGNIKDRYEAYRIGLEKNFLQIDEVRKKEDLPPIGFDWMTLGLDSVLYNPKTDEVYTPNTNATQKLTELQPVKEGDE